MLTYAEILKAVEKEIIEKMYRIDDLKQQLVEERKELNELAMSAETLRKECEDIPQDCYIISHG